MCSIYHLIMINQLICVFSFKFDLHYLISILKKTSSNPALKYVCFVIFILIHGTLCYLWIIIFSYWNTTGGGGAGGRITWMSRSQNSFKISGNTREINLHRQRDCFVDWNLESWFWASTRREGSTGRREVYGP